VPSSSTSRGHEVSIWREANQCVMVKSIAVRFTQCQNIFTPISYLAFRIIFKNRYLFILLHHKILAILNLPPISKTRSHPLLLRSSQLKNTPKSMYCVQKFTPLHQCYAILRDVRVRVNA
jgi:hypothetical protein